MLISQLPPGQVEPHQTEMKPTRMRSFWLIDRVSGLEENQENGSTLTTARSPPANHVPTATVRTTMEPDSVGSHGPERKEPRRAETARSHRLHLHTSPPRAHLCPPPWFSGSPADSWSGFVFVPLNGNPGIVALCH